MKFLILSDSGDSLGLALRLKEEGNKVSMYIQKEWARSPETSLVEEVSLPIGLSRQPDVIIADYTGMGHICDRLRREGRRVMGGGSFQDKLEQDRTFGFKLADQVGISLPPYKSFSSIKDAMEHVTQTKERYVLKPDKGSSDMTYVSKSSEDMLAFLVHAEKKRLISGKFILQKFIPGFELGTNMFFSNGDPVYPGDETIEAKKLMNGDLGPNTGCQATVLWPLPEGSKVIKQTLEKLFPALKKEQYSGPLDVNAIITRSGAYFLEYTPRFGYSASYSWAQLFGRSQSLGQAFYDCANGTLKKLDLRPEYAFTLRVSIPPYPLYPFDPKNREIIKQSAGHKLGWTPKKTTWLLDVHKDEEGDLVTQGLDGAIMEIGSEGKDLKKLDKEVYEMAGKLELANKMYRTDGTQRAQEQIPELKKMGYEVI